MKLFKIYNFIFACLFASHAFGGVPLTSEYYTDSQSTSVQDATSDTFNFANMVDCYVKALRLEAMKGKGYYYAQIDSKKCDKSQTASSTAQGGAVPIVKYDNVMARSDLDAAGNLIGKISIHSSHDDGTPNYVQVAIKIKNGYIEKPPNGEWRIDFCSSNSEPSNLTLGLCDDGVGFADVNQANVRVFQGSNRNAINYGSGLIDYTASKIGTGIAKNVNGNNTLNLRVAFDPSHYLVASALGTNPETISCTDPRIGNGTNTLYNVWDTYLYDSSSGSKVLFNNGGFAIKTPNSPSGNDGYANYWGVNFWDSAPMGDQVAGTTITGNNNSYTLGIAKGKLQKVTRNQIALSDMNGINFKFYFNNNTNDASQNLYHDLTGLAVPQNSWVSFIGQWNSATSKFDIFGYQICGTNCTNGPLTATSISLASLAQTYKASNFGGWIDGAGLNYNSTFASSNDNGNSYTVNNLSTILVNRELDLQVAPNDNSVSRLICIGWNCPYLDVNNQLQISRPNTYPFTAADIYAYSWNHNTGQIYFVTGAVNGAGGTVTNTAYAFLNTGSGPFETSSDINATYSINPLIPLQNLPQLTCKNDNTKYCNVGDSNSSYAGDYYQWNTGNQWNQYNYLIDSSNNVVTFAPPITLQYTVSQSPPPGVNASYAGKTLSFQSPGQGNIWYPSHCISTANNNAVIDCNSTDPSKQWVTDVYVPTVESSDGMVTLLNTDGTPSNTKYLVKWTSRGAILESKSANYCSALSLPAPSSLAQPSITDWIDPTNPSSSNYFGTGNLWVAPPSSGTPKIVHGVIQ